MVMTHLIYSNGLATNLPSELVFLALPSNNLCSLVGVVEWAFILSERHTQVTFVVTAASFNVQRVVCTVIRNRATHGFLLNFIMSYYLGHQNKTRVCHCPNMFGVRLQVTICWIDSNNLPNSRKPTQMDYSSTDITFPFWKQTFRPQKSNFRFKEIALPIARVAFVLKCHQIIYSNYICFSQQYAVGVSGHTRATSISFTDYTE